MIFMGTNSCFIGVFGVLGGDGSRHVCEDNANAYKSVQLLKGWFAATCKAG